jgi:hypothetical protein
LQPYGCGYSANGNKPKQFSSFCRTEPPIIYKGMVEAFKTNVQKKAQSKMLHCLLLKAFPSFKINFDLSDCDKVLRVEGDDIVAFRIAFLLNESGFRCEILD